MIYFDSTVKKNGPDDNMPHNCMRITLPLLPSHKLQTMYV